MHFCFELQKKMNLLYKNPVQPVDVNILGRAALPELGASMSQSPRLSPMVAPPSPGGSVSTDMANSKYATLQALFAPKSDA